MRALVHTEPGRLEYGDFPTPEIAPEEILVRVKACGICGSDVHGYTGASGRRIPPLVMGHEAAGIIEATGSDVTSLQKGQRVCLDSTVYCNRCDACRRGAINYCEKRQVLGVSVPEFRRHGAFAEFVAVPWWSACPLPDDLSFRQAALLEPVSIALHAVNRSPLEHAQRVLIIGAGPIGLFTLQAVRLRTAARATVCDLNEFRLELARRLGADDVTQSVQPQHHGDVTFEAVGLTQTFQLAFSSTRTGGHVTVVGNLAPSVALDLQELVSRELTLRGTYASSGEFREALALVEQGSIRVDPLISEVAPLSEGQRCFDRLRDGRENLLKIILEP